MKVCDQCGSLFKQAVYNRFCSMGCYRKNLNHYRKERHLKRLNKVRAQVGLPPLTQEKYAKNMMSLKMRKDFK